MTQYGFYFDATRCTGCKTCEAACRDGHDLGTDSTYRHVYELEGGSWSKDEKGCWITDSYTYYTSFACQHCDDPACMHVCPTGAMHKDENGIVSVDIDRCIGCGYCAMACPYDAPHVDRSKGHSVKCDGCAERVSQGKRPLCVDACTVRALQFAPVEKLPEKGVRADIAPLPDPRLTAPNLYINPCAASRPFGDTECRVANASEVK
ncbi:DMSO/selenate family reductase complex B subunit [Slackia piriformis]|uniref:DMSO/selenate family reductase complex B subunit n=1 Tax=Slackia piriformis TaxID=626934 RepID=UPI002F939F69